MKGRVPLRSEACLRCGPAGTPSVVSSSVQQQDATASFPSALSVAQTFTDAAALDLLATSGPQPFADALRVFLAAAMEVPEASVLLEGSSVSLLVDSAQSVVQVNWGINTASSAEALSLQERLAGVPASLANQMGEPPHDLTHAAPCSTQLPPRQPLAAVCSS